MKYFILIANAFIALTLAQQTTDNKYKNIPIVSQDSNLEHDGTFSYSFENGDGTRAQQNGQLKYVDNENAGEAVQGGYSYTVSERPAIILWVFLKACSLRVTMERFTHSPTLPMKMDTDRSATSSRHRHPSQQPLQRLLSTWSRCRRKISDLESLM